MLPLHYPPGNTSIEEAGFEPAKELIRAVLSRLPLTGLGSLPWIIELGIGETGFEPATVRYGPPPKGGTFGRTRSLPFLTRYK